MWQRDGDDWICQLGSKELTVCLVSPDKWVGYVREGSEQFMYDSTWRTADDAKAAIVALELYKEQG